MTALAARIAPPTARLSARERLLVDAWLIALLVDRLAFPFDAARPLAIMSLLLTLLALIGRSPRVAAGAFAFDAAKLVLLMPDMANHLTVLFFVDVLLVWYLLRPRQTDAIVLMQPIRVMAVLLYAVAAVHKMNSSFLDAVTSCATYIADSTLSWFWLPNLGGLGTVAAWSALAIEAVLPVLLVFPRTRRAAIFIGLVFHGALAFAPIIGVASFSVFMVATYVAFFDDAMVERVTQWRRAIPRRVLDASLQQQVLVASIIAAAVTVVNRFAPDGSFLLAGVAGIAVCVAVFLLLVGRSPMPAAAETAPDVRKVQLYSIVVAAFILLAAAAPYVGARTQLSFSMFSNLRTETAANHLFLPQLDVFDIQGDLVTLIESPHARFADISGPELVVPSYEVGRRLALVDGVESITVLEDGQEATYTGAAMRERFPEPGLLSSWLFRVRATESAGPVSCRH
jgi:hypothetical protein